MVWEHVAEFPHASVARYVRVIVNLFAQTWLEITSFTKVTEAEPPQLSLVLTLAGLAVGTRFAHITVIFWGQVMDGGI